VEGDALEDSAMRAVLMRAALPMLIAAPMALWLWNVLPLAPAGGPAPLVVGTPRAAAAPGGPLTEGEAPAGTPLDGSMLLDAALSAEDLATAEAFAAGLDGVEIIEAPCAVLGGAEPAGGIPDHVLALIVLTAVAPSVVGDHLRVGTIASSLASSLRALSTDSSMTSSGSPIPSSTLAESCRLPSNASGTTLTAPDARKVRA